MTERQTIVVIGCGNIADTHVEAILQAAPGQRICVCDPLPGKAGLLRRKYGLAEAYTSAEEMLEREKPLAAHIVSPPQLHVRHAELALENGCHVLVEKPVCLSRQDAARLLEMAARRGLLLTADHSVLYQPSVRHMLSMIGREAGEKVVHVSCCYGLDIDSGNPEALFQGHWKRTLPGGVLLDTVIHPITLAVELAGGEPSDVTVCTDGKDGSCGDLLLSWRTESASVSIEVSARARPFRRVTEVATTSRLFTVDHSTETLVVVGEGAGPKGLQKVLRNLSYSYQLSKGTVKTAVGVVTKKIQSNPGTRGLVKAFYDTIRGRDTITIGAQNILASVAVLEKVVHALPGRPAAPAARPRPQETGPRVLVTGASGFLGRQVCAALIKAGARVIAQVRRSKGADELPSEVTRIYADLGDPTSDIRSLVEGCSGVVHCAHASGEKDWAGFKRVNVDSACRLYDAAAKAGVGRFIMVSSAAVYGVHGMRRRTVSESTRLRQQPRYDFYARSKALADRCIIAKAASGRLPALILRPGVLYSGRGEKLCRRAIPTARDRRLVISMGGGANPLPFTRVEALSETICRHILAPGFPTGVYNVCGDPGMRSRLFVRRGMARLGIRVRFLTLPAGVFRAIGWIAEGLSLLRGRKRAPKLSRYIVDSGTRWVRYDCSRAARDLGWDPKQAAELPQRPS